MTWDDLNIFFENNIAISSIAGLLCLLVALFTISKTIQSWLYKLFSKKSNISGDWLLIIYNKDKTIYKIDHYVIKQVANVISGKIKRLFSEEDSSQTKTRKYKFSGFFLGNEIVYSFTATNPLIHSYGNCNLMRTYDFEFEGWYFVPKGKKSKSYPYSRYKIKLTRSLSGLSELHKSEINISRKILNHPINK